MSTKTGIISRKELRSTLRLSQERLAKIVGVSTRSIARWEHDEVAINPYTLGKLAMINACVHEAKTIMNPDEVVRWFNSKIPALDGDKPIDLLSQPEGIEMVHRTLCELKYGIIG